MLPKARRISKTEFGGILKSNKRFSSSHFVLYLAQNKGKINELSRFSFSVSKKVAKSAVERNTLRRRGYAVARKFINRVKNGYFLLFSFKNKEVSIGSIEKELEELLLASTMLS